MILSILNRFIHRPSDTSAPPHKTPQAVGLPDYEEVAIETADGLTLAAWYLPASSPRHALLYLHGTAGDRRDWVEFVPPLVQAGVSVLLPDYRGYGGSEGTPHEAGLYQDGAAAWQWLEQQAAAAGIPVSIWGKSLGTSVAIHTAVTQSPPYRLLLASAFTSMTAVLTLHAPDLLAPLIPSLYESLRLAPQLRCPTLLIHGAADNLVPPLHSQRLYDAVAAPKELQIIPGADHSTLQQSPAYYKTILTFLDQETFF